MSRQHSVSEPAQVFAVFMDLMGFADRLELLSDEDHLKLDRALEDNLVPRLGEPQPPLEGAYWSYFHFHAIVERFVNDVSSDCKMIAVFSDSAFVATSSLSEAEDIAACVTGQAVFLGAYTRIGIGYGTLARLDWHSRVSLSGALTMSSPFLGTSVTRAYRAQQGCLGFRILLHPSVRPAAQDPSWHRVALQGADLTKDRNAELNFMDTLSDFSLDDHLLKKLALMKLSAPDERSREHYDVTARAMQNLQALGAAEDWNGRRRSTVTRMLKLVFNDP